MFVRGMPAPTPLLREANGGSRTPSVRQIWTPFASVRVDASTPTFESAGRFNFFGRRYQRAPDATVGSNIAPFINVSRGHDHDRADSRRSSSVQRTDAGKSQRDAQAWCSHQHLFSVDKFSGYDRVEGRPRAMSACRRPRSSTRRRRQGVSTVLQLFGLILRGRRRQQYGLDSGLQNAVSTMSPRQLFTNRPIRSRGFAHG